MRHKHEKALIQSACKSAIAEMFRSTKGACLFGASAEVRETGSRLLLSTHTSNGLSFFEVVVKESF